MLTTALRIELLIIGFQTLPCQFLLASPSTRETLMDSAEVLKEHSAAIAVLILAWCYSAGVVVDAIAGVIEDPKSLLLGSRKSAGRSAHLRLKFPEALDDLVRMDFELRLMRATSLNAMLTAAIAFWGPTYLPDVASILSIAGIVIGLAWFRRRTRYRQRRAKIDELAVMLTKKHSNGET